MKHFLYKQPKTLLNKGSGFLSGYSHTLNPYTGCTFGCSYCYVRRMPVSSFRKEEWGTWADIKQGAAELLEKELTRAKKKGRVTIFMSSSTDPYQPIEHRERITRSLLEVMSVNQPDFLLVQTRSPLVQRDIDLLGRLKDRVRVSVTVETDREDIRRRFAPEAPSIQGRLHTLKVLSEAGIPVQAAVAPICLVQKHFRKNSRRTSPVFALMIILWETEAAASGQGSWELNRSMRNWICGIGTLPVLTVKYITEWQTFFHRISCM